MDFGRALSFIEAHGSDLEQARFLRIFFDAPPEPRVVQPFIELQNEDGGFPCSMAQGNPSCVHKTLNALMWMDGLGMLASPTANGCYDYVLATQRDDGGWDEDPAIAQYNPPPWIRTGDLATRLYLSAYAAYWLALGGRRTHPAFGPALGFVLKHRDDRGKVHGFLHSTWIATSVFYLADPLYYEAARQGLQVLMDRPLSQWEDSQIAWALECLGKAGVPADQPFVKACLAVLPERQAPDGCWASEDGEAFAVGATIAVLKVLKLYGLMHPDRRPTADDR